jgi:hypothetical protein
MDSISANGQVSLDFTAILQEDGGCFCVYIYHAAGRSEHRGDTRSLW